MAKREYKPYCRRSWKVSFRPELLKEHEAGSEADLIIEIERQIADFRQTILALQLYRGTKRNRELRDVKQILRLIDPMVPARDNKIVTKFITYTHEPPNTNADRKGDANLPADHL